MSDHATHLLPDEIVEEIILKLPSKPLIRFKSLSKTWCSLITTPHFLAKHLLPAAHDGGNLLLVKRSHKTNKRDLVFSLLSHHNLTPTRLGLVPYQDPEEASPPISPQIQISGPWLLLYPDLTHPWHGWVSILGPRNGLVCLSNGASKRHILLWNLADGKVKALPGSDVPDPLGYRSFMPLLGFGHDVATQDYKVIRISTLSPPDHEYFKEYSNHKIEIYSFNANTWKGYSDFERKFCVEEGISHPMEAYLDGVMVWLACTAQYDYVQEQECKDYFILWFRMSDESFGETLLPSKAEIESVNNGPFGKYGYDIWWAKLFFVMKDETLVFVTYDMMLEGVEVCFHAWALLEFGVEDSWTRLFTFGPLTGIDRPLWFCNNGSMIMETKKGELVLYHPFTKEMISLNISGVKLTLQILSIEERLVL